jgi:hypothetical protein
MATLGEKVTTTLVSAVLKGITETTVAQHEDIKPLVEDQIREYLKNPNLPASTRKQYEAMLSSTGVVDVIVSIVGLFVGLIGGLMASGEPTTEAIRQVVWSNSPQRLPPEQAAILAWWRGLHDESQARNYLFSHGYNLRPQNVIIESLRPLLDDDSIRDLLLRGEITYKELSDYLRSKGWRDTDIVLLQKLYWRIPGAQDLIRMAVREAFTPEIAERFGQYQDLPPDFVAWAAKQGIDSDWAKRYWAAHWDLPSATQGFEMLHRGVIDQPTLDLLLRALDVMPFWRDKLTKIAFNPYTRVDVRRMYGLKVLGREEVKTAYKDLGYDDDKAEKMTEFTVKYETSSEKDLAKTDILDGYRRKIITRADAEELLAELGYSDEEVDFYLNREDLKRAQGYSDDLVETYRKQFLSAMITESDARTKLNSIGVEPERINELITLWVEQKATKEFSPEVLAEKNLTKSEVVSGYVKGLLSREETDTYLTGLGYDPGEREFLLNQADYDKAKQVKDLSLSTYKELYTTGLLDKTAVTSALVNQGFKKEELEYLYTLWDIEAEGNRILPTRADLTRFLKKGIITWDTFVVEMRRRGYDDTAITWYLQDMEGGE